MDFLFYPQYLLKFLSLPLETFYCQAKAKAEEEYLFAGRVSADLPHPAYDVARELERYIYPFSGVSEVSETDQRVAEGTISGATLRWLGKAKLIQLSTGGSGIDPATVTRWFHALEQVDLRRKFTGNWYALSSYGDVLHQAWMVHHLQYYGLTVDRPGDLMALIRGSSFTAGISAGAVIESGQVIADTLSLVEVIAQELSKVSSRRPLLATVRDSEPLVRSATSSLALAAHAVEESLVRPGADPYFNAETKQFEPIARVLQPEVTQGLVAVLQTLYLGRAYLLGAVHEWSQMRSDAGGGSFPMEVLEGLDKPMPNISLSFRVNGSDNIGCIVDHTLFTAILVVREIVNFRNAIKNVREELQRIGHLAPPDENPVVVPFLLSDITGMTL